MYFFCACEKNHKKIRSSYLVQKAFSKINLTVLMKVTEQLYCRKNLCGCFRFIWLWLLISIINSVQNHAYCNCIIPSVLTYFNRNIFIFVFFFKKPLWAAVNFVYHLHKTKKSSLNGWRLQSKCMRRKNFPSSFFVRLDLVFTELPVWSF